MASTLVAAIALSLLWSGLGAWALPRLTFGAAVMPLDGWVLGALSLSVPVAGALAGQTGLLFWAGCGLGWGLVLLGCVDLRAYRLPDMLTLPLILMGLALSLAGRTGPALEHLCAAGAGFALLCGLDAGYRALRGRMGMGRGDAKLLAAGGAWTGGLGLLSIVFLSALIGLVAALIAQRGRFDGAAPVPFGPALALGIWITWLVGPVLIRLP